MDIPTETNCQKTIEDNSGKKFNSIEWSSDIICAFRIHTESKIEKVGDWLARMEGWKVKTKYLNKVRYLSLHSAKPSTRASRTPFLGLLFC